MPRYQPIQRHTLPSNTRAVSVAQQTIANVLPHAARRMDNSYKVEGYPVCVYHRLSAGQPCNCKKVPSLLNPDGTADPSVLNSMLTGGQEFGVIAYGNKVADQHRNENYPTPQNPETIDYTQFYIDDVSKGSKGSYLREHPKNVNSLTGTLGKQSKQVKAQNIPAKYQNDSNLEDNAILPQPGTAFDIWATSPDVDAHASTIVAGGVGPNGPIGNWTPQNGAASGNPDVFYDPVNLPYGFDSLSLTDVGCPVCMGTGFVGGYAPITGRRVVLTAQSNGYSGPFDTTTEETIPTTGLSGGVEWKVIFPRFVTGVDAIRIWNKTSPLYGQFYIDGDAITKPSMFADPKYCTGTEHTVRFVPTSSADRFTHLELQWSIAESHYCDFPKISKSASSSFVDSTGDINVGFGPSLPLIRPFDVFTDSIVGKCWRVDNVTPHHTRSKFILSWDVSAVVAQPQEFINMLPVRKPVYTGLRSVQINNTRTRL